MKKNGKSILFITKYPESTSPSQRFRIELYIGVLEEYGFKTKISPFFCYQEYKFIYKPGFFFKKSAFIFKGLFRRFFQLFSIGKFDYIFILKEAAPLGPPFFEWIYTRVLNKKVIYDFDDAIWIPKISEHNTLASIFKNSDRVKSICKWAYKVSCGNTHLCSYAKKFNPNIIYNPTCVDTQNRHNIICNHDVDKITIGWTGSFSTLTYLELIIPVLNKLQTNYDFNVKIICNQKPSFKLKNVQHIEWSVENEIIELSTCQIGLMPLTNDEWSKGKCGFKIIQYLSLEIPAVSSAVGVNKSIIKHGVNGFLCDTEEEWYNCIENLLLNAQLRKDFGKNGRRKIIEKYSLSSNKLNFVGLFQ